MAIHCPHCHALINRAVLSCAACRKAVPINSSDVPEKGDKVWWAGSKGETEGPGIIDFIHQEPDGTTWLFATTSQGWRTISQKIVTRVKSVRETN